MAELRKVEYFDEKLGIVRWRVEKKDRAILCYMGEFEYSWRVCKKRLTESQADGYIQRYKEFMKNGGT